jgi:hypothetical protein
MTKVEIVNLRSKSIKAKVEVERWREGGDAQLKRK